MAKSRLHELSGKGVSVWFDTLSRDLVQTGELKRMMDDDSVVGVTSNPTIFQKALSSGNAYDADMKKLLESTDDPTEIFFSLALQDIRDACDVLKPAYDASNGVDGYVSMEVLPSLAYDAEATFDQVQRISKEVDRPNLYVKIPATAPGLPAIENAKLAYQHYLDVFSGPRWEFLESKGATKQRCLWASTSTKNPAYRDVMYVEELIGPETVNTMPL